jgi:hypothetical protein
MRCWLVSYDSRQHKDTAVTLQDICSEYTPVEWRLYCLILFLHSCRNICPQTFLDSTFNEAINVSIIILCIALVITSTVHHIPVIPVTQLTITHPSNLPDHSSITNSFMHSIIAHIHSSIQTSIPSIS